MKVQVLVLLVLSTVALGCKHTSTLRQVLAQAGNNNSTAAAPALNITNAGIDPATLQTVEENFAALYD